MTVPATMHEEEALGKAYDARLMRRLLVYLRPYWRSVAVAFVALFVGAAANLAQPYLMKVAIDRYIGPGQLAGLNGLALMYVAILVVACAPSGDAHAGRTETSLVLALAPTLVRGDPVAGNPANGENRSEPVAFLEKGTYLVICNIRPHLLDGMYAYVKVN